MSQNPYDAPSTLAVQAAPPKSRRVYWIASAIVLGLLATVLAVAAWMTVLTVSDGYVSLELLGAWVPTSPLAQGGTSYITMVSTTTDVAITLLAMLSTILLAIVNGMIFFWRRRKRLS